VIRAGATIALAVTLLMAGAAQAASLQPIGNFDAPMYVTSDPSNPDRLFVAERDGRIKQVQGGAVSTFAQIAGVGTDGPGQEGGLLSIALAPDFGSSGLLYVDYTDEEGEIHVAQLRASGENALGATPLNLLSIPHADATNHYGGQLQFGPEGNLFISTGDGGGGNDQFHNAQRLNSLLGKILRIDPHPSGALPYTVPAGNPFPGLGAPYDTIWSLGLRNPFRFSFDLRGGDLWIGDVGQVAREEVDFAAAPGLGAGANYGWSCREGPLPGNGSDPACAAPASPFVEPIFDYPHSDPGNGGAFGKAIIGGYLVRDPSLGDLNGRYLYGDLTGGVRSFNPASPYTSDRSEGIRVEALNSFGQDSCGRLYTVSGLGTISRVVGAAAPSCSPPGKALLPSFVGIKALRRKVQRNRRALLTAWVSPCAGRRGQGVALMRGRVRLGVRHLDRACTVRFRPRISHRWNFRAVIKADTTYVGDESRRLKIRVDHRRKHHRRARASAPGSSPGRWR
jgi:hypothetical protein